jgi:hypothetical protein
VLAGTELNLIFNAANTDFPAVDCARAHINGIIRQLATQQRGCGSILQDGRSLVARWAYSPAF